MSPVVKREEADDAKVPKMEQTESLPPSARRRSYAPNPNKTHPRGKATPQDCLVVLNSAESVRNQRKALQSNQWSTKDISCMMSLRNSVAWDALTELLNEPFYVHVACGTVADWATEYLSYPILRLVFWDMVQQQRQIRAMMKKPGQVTMELFYGDKWYPNQRMNKSGSEETMKTLWKAQSISKHFTVSFKEFWTRATHREKSSNGLESGTRFLFGLMIPSVNDINFHSYISNFGDLIHRSKRAASLLHLLLYYPNHRKPIRRRKNDPKKEVDWVDILVQPGDRTAKVTGEKRLAGEAIVLHILVHIDELVPFDSSNLQTGGKLPHDEISLSGSMTELKEYVELTMGVAWNNLINLCDSYCLWLSPAILKIRHAMLS